MTCNICAVHPLGLGVAARTLLHVHDDMELRRRRTHTARWAPPTIAPDRVVAGQRLESSMLLPLPLAVTAARTDLTVARLRYCHMCCNMLA